MRVPANVLVVMNDGATLVLAVEEWQAVEPSAYCWEAGAWLYSTTGEPYFVSLDGRVDRWRDNDGDLEEIQMGAGLAPEWDEAARRFEAQIASAA